MSYLHEKCTLSTRSTGIKPGSPGHCYPGNGTFFGYLPTALSLNFCTEFRVIMLNKYNEQRAYFQHGRLDFICRRSKDVMKKQLNRSRPITTESRRLLHKMCRGDGGGRATTTSCVCRSGQPSTIPKLTFPSITLAKS